jgi:autotransporter-associated beta strand protein
LEGRERVVLSKTHLSMLLFIAACGSAQIGPTTVERKSPGATTDSSAQLSEDTVRFSTAVIQALSDDANKPPASNSYSHQKLLGPRKRLGEPQVQLESTDAHSLLASTDCSGWLSFVLNTISPLHQAVLQAQRGRDEHNRLYSEDFALRESRRPWSRAFVVAQYLRSGDASATGFETVTSFEDLRSGDIGAYAMGRYAKPSDDSRPKPRDTGHVFIVAGSPTVVDPSTKDYDGRGTLEKDAVKVIAVPVIDSSATLHFDPDSRKNADGHYRLPKVRPHSRAKPGGVGTGTIWFALSEEGRVLQRRLGPQQKYRPVLARAARLSGNIALDEGVLDDGGALLVRVFDNSPAEFAGMSYGDAPIHLTGEGGLRIGSGRLVLNGNNDFSGGVTVQSADLIVSSPTGLGVGDVVIRGGTMTLHEPAISDSATLSVAEGLAEGAIRLDFRGRDVVRMLRIGDATHHCGTWGGPDSRAMFVDPAFSGRGILELSAQPRESCAPPSKGSPRRRAGGRTSSEPLSPSGSS